MSEDRHYRRIKRYTPGERTNHWIIAFTFILLALSGLALFSRSGRLSALGFQPEEILARLDSRFKA